MTIYTDSNGMPITEVTPNNIKQYMELAQKAFENGEANQTFLALAPTADDKTFTELQYYGFFTEKAAHSALYVMTETLRQTLHTASPQQTCDLIDSMTNYFSEGSLYSLPEAEKNYQKAVSEVVSEEIKDSKWLDKLDAKAKLSLALLNLKNGLSLSEEEKAKLCEFEIPKDDRNNNILRTGFVAKKLLKQDSEWEFKAAGLKTLIELKSSDSRYLVENFVKLVETAENAAQVDKLSEMVDKMGQDFENCRNLNDPNLQFNNWSQLVPPTENAENLFYKYIQTADPDLKYIGEPSFNQSNPNALAYSNAVNESRADLELRNLRNGQNFNMKVIENFGLNKFNLKTDFPKLSVGEQKKFLDKSYHKAEPQKYLQMATMVINNEESNLSPAQFADILNKVQNYKPAASKDMESFCDAAQKLAQKLTETAVENKNYIKKRDTLEADLMSTKRDVSTFKNMASLVNNLKSSFMEIESFKSKQDSIYHIDSVETFIANALSHNDGKNTASSLPFKPMGKLKQMFSNKQAVQKHQNLGQAVEKFNRALAECLKEPGFKEFSGKMLQGSTIRDLSDRSDKAREKSQKLDNQIAPVYEYSEKSKFITDFDKLKINEQVDSLSNKATIARKELKEKAKLALSMGFQGMETDKPMLEEHEQRSTETYAAKAKEVEEKLSNLHKQDLKERGVLDPNSPKGRPSDQNSSKTGQPMSKDTKEKVSQIIQTQKAYEKLAKR